MMQYFITQKLVGIAARHILTATGAYMAAQGWVDPATDAAALDAITGGGVAAVGLLWSIVEKSKR